MSYENQLFITAQVGCELCPRKCGIVRKQGKVGVCGAGEVAQVALADLHMWEEPPITGEHGSGAIFFSHCPLKCVYCQNCQISREGKGKEVTPVELAKMMLDLQARGATNINLVTGTHYLPQIEEALALVGRLPFQNHVRLESENGIAGDSVDLMHGSLDSIDECINWVGPGNSERNDNFQNDVRLASEVRFGQVENHVRLAREASSYTFQNDVRLAEETDLIGQLDIPIVWNTSGYETVETVRRLNRFVDIYLTDFKYFSDELGNELSGVKNYCQVATDAIKCMLEKRCETSCSDNDEINSAEDNSKVTLDGFPTQNFISTFPYNKSFNEASNEKRPEVIVRHLILPGHTQDSKNVIKHVYDEFGDSVTLSIMNQYTPVLKSAAEAGDGWAAHVLQKHPELGRTVSDEEYEEVLDFADSLGIDDYFWQEGETCKESFIPNF